MSERDAAMRRMAAHRQRAEQDVEPRGEQEFILPNIGRVTAPVVIGSMNGLLERSGILDTDSQEQEGR